jgi:hypothetical protein
MERVDTHFTQFSPSSFYPLSYKLSILDYPFPYQHPSISSKASAPYGLALSFVMAHAQSARAPDVTLRAPPLHISNQRSP